MSEGDSEFDTSLMKEMEGNEQGASSSQEVQSNLAALHQMEQETAERFTAKSAERSRAILMHGGTKVQEWICEELNALKLEWDAIKETIANNMKALEILSQKEVGMDPRNMRKCSHVLAELMGNDIEGEEQSEFKIHEDSSVESQATKRYKLKLIPNNLPQFGMAEGEIMDPEEFTQRFQVCLKAYDQDMDKNWQRLLQMCMPMNSFAWLEDMLEDDMPWSMVKALLVKHYGDPQKQTVRYQSLLTM